MRAGRRLRTTGPDDTTETVEPVIPTEAARLTWERRAEWPLTIAALIFLGAFAWPILDPALTATWAATCDVIVWATWCLFVIDYATRVLLSRNRWLFVRSNLIDLLSVVLPILRPLRLLRLLTVLNAINRYAGGSLRGKVILYVTGSVTLTIFVASLAVLDAERGAEGGNIHGFGDAVWWAITTMTTVGYGDRFPVTTTGRVVATGLMLTGIALIGVVTASLASWLLDRVKAVEDAAQAATRKDLAVVTAELAALRRELAIARPAEQPVPTPSHLLTINRAR